MTRAEIAAFHQRFVTLSALVGQTGEHWNTILLHLKKSRVRRFSPRGEDFGHLYLREDVEHAFWRGG